VLQRERARVPGPDGEPGVRHELVGLERHRRRERQHAGRAPSRDPAVDELQQRGDEAVLGPGCVLELEVHRTGDADDLAQDRGDLTRAQVVAPFVATHRERVGEDDRAFGRGEGGLERQRVVEVSTRGLDLRVFGGSDRPVSAASSRMRAKIDGPSKRGKQSQSMDPPRLTNAAERQSDSSA
jgi:hypothetical protein